MNYLVDTHILIWSILDSEKLSKTILDIISNQENKIFVSTVSLWEISIKYKLGKLTFDNFEPNLLFEYMNQLGFDFITLDPLETLNSYKLPLFENHKDPFDRLLIYQAIKRDLILISKDNKFIEYSNVGLKLL
jgi:PIN domain nuclease of toxin-antitoxin system